MFLRFTNLTVGLVALYCSTSWAAPPIDFIQEIQPILAEHCSHCHGVDDQSRQSNLRLDLAADAYRGGDSGEAAIVPGKPDQGTFLRRIESHDPDEIMPPPKENKPLTDAQKQKLKQWIAEGANYQSHWAFVPPKKISIDLTGRHPIDAIVQEKLVGLGMSQSPKESNEILCRRIYLDIVGLPPSIAELEAFAAEGVEATVIKLLASERYGEKWGRHWLDAARYSDTNGYEKDLQRDQWAWRDWVIQALNQDMSYQQFVIEQIAGDLLPGAKQEQIVATGFLRNSMLNEEGAIVPEQFRMFEMFDRLDCIGKSILGLTTQCAQCHNHKFDPLSQEDYYGMFAYLNDTYEAQSWVYREDQSKKIDELKRAMDQLDDQIKNQQPDWSQQVDQFARGLADHQAPWKPIRFHQWEAISGLNHPVQQADESILMLGHSSNDIFFVGRPDLSNVTGIRLELLPHRDLPFGGPGRSRVGGWSIQELEVWIKRVGGADWEKQKLIHATADFSEPDQKQSDGKKAVGPVGYLIDGSDETSWKADRGTGRRNQASVAVMQFETPLNLPPDSEIKVVMRMGDMPGCIRISTSASPGPEALPIDYQAILAANTPVTERTRDQQSELFEAWRKSKDELKSLQTEYDLLWAQYPQGHTSVLHLASRSTHQRRTTYLLDRGNWDQPKHLVAPKVPNAYFSTGGGQPASRLEFARWLVDPKSPLAARVVVNRVWQAIFGEGLVETSEDFGTRAPVPEHRELLDWLAVDLMENGWSQKYLVKTIVTSSTYQQRSQWSEVAHRRDSKNRWLARGPRFRADAEVIRDIALSVSGLIHHRLGGPGIIPPVPQNVLDYNYTYPSYWTPATGPERYRRTVYGFRKRSMPDPVMASFDGPNADFSCARRVRSNTPLAALAGLNETIFVEAAQALALRVLREGGSDDSSRIAFAFRLCTSRLPTTVEMDELHSMLIRQRKRIAEGWLNPREIATGDPSKLPSLPEGVNPQDAAAWTLVARVLLNLDETISKN